MCVCVCVFARACVCICVCRVGGWGVDQIQNFYLMNGRVIHSPLFEFSFTSFLEISTDARVTLGDTGLFNIVSGSKFKSRSNVVKSLIIRSSKFNTSKGRWCNQIFTKNVILVVSSVIHKHEKYLIGMIV